MQGRIGFKNIFQQRSGDFPVHLRPGIDHVLQTRPPLKTDQRADPPAAQVHHGLDDLGYDPLPLVLPVGPGLPLGQQRTPPHLLQGFPDFGLKENQQHNRSVVQNRPHQPVQAGQPQQGAEQNNDRHKEDTLQQRAASCPPKQHKHLVDNDGHDDDVQDIHNAQPVGQVPAHIPDQAPYIVHRGSSFESLAVLALYHESGAFERRPERNFFDFSP